MDNTLKHIVLDWIPSQSKVIDFGCGDGALLKILSEQKSIIGYGVENDPDKINACIINGVSVIQQDIDAGIHNYKGMGFDVAVMASSIQCLRKPRDAMKNILKVANVDIDAHVDSHAKDGFCNVVRIANVKGKVKKNKLYADSFSIQ